MKLDIDESGVKYTYAMRNYDEKHTDGTPSNRSATVLAKCKKFEVTNMTWTDQGNLDNLFCPWCMKT